MKHSEIFDNFVKIAEEKGMISNDSAKSKKKLEETGRADSLDISAIEALYGVKPDAPKESQYKSNIMEIAHPNSVVVSPSYDKLNGLVENEIERQNISINIVMKPTDGHSTQRKYAQKELLLSLVRIANDLDNQNQEELRTLADTCLLQIHNKPLKKTALVPVLVGAALVLTAIWSYEHLPNMVQGIKQDSTILLEALNKMLNSNSDYGIGHMYDSALKSDVQGAVDRINKFLQTFNSLADIARSIEKPTDGSELEEQTRSVKTQEVIQANAKLKELAAQMSHYLTTLHDDFTSDVYKNRHTEETGMFSSLLEKTHLLGGKTSLLGDDFEDVLRAIPTFKSSVDEVVKFYEVAMPAHQKKVEEDLQQKYDAQLGSKPSKSSDEPDGSAGGPGGEGNDSESVHTQDNSPISMIEKGLGEILPGFNT